MELGNIAQLGSLALALLAFAVSIIGASRKGLEGKIQVVADDLDSTQKAVAETSVRVAALEREIGHLPDSQTAHRLELAIADLRSEVAVMTERLKPVAAIGDRLQEFLLEQARK